MSNAARWLALLLALGAVSDRAVGDEAGVKPNFVFILIDDLGWKDVGCFGSKFYQTPNIDRLAAQGMRLTNAYAAGPVCSPTRASILTGKYPARLHLTDYLTGRSDRPSQKLLRPKVRQYLPPEEITIARALKPLRYVSASIGKWHLGREQHGPLQHGFDVNKGGTETGSPPGGYFRFKTPTLSARNDQEYLTDRLTEEAENFLDQNKDKPFFLYLAHYAVHIPLEAKKDLLAKYQASVRPDRLQNNPIYGAMVESVDESVGRIMKKLDDLKIAGKTVVFFFSDNGGLSVKEGPNTPATSNAPLRAGKGYLYEGGIREPLIIHWPGMTPAGSVCEVSVASVDFFPTILEIADSKGRFSPHQLDYPRRPPTLALPHKGGGKNLQSLDGLSLLPLLRRSGGLHREALYWHYPHYSNQGGKPSGAVRKDDYKLIEFFEDGKLELYNLRDDIGELNDLSRTMPEKTEELHTLLKAWRQSVAAQMPTPNPNFKPELAK
jgi:arylsulfatase A-like enzyme